jgi:TonB family protein
MHRSRRFLASLGLAVLAGVLALGMQADSSEAGGLLLAGTAGQREVPDTLRIELSASGDVKLGDHLLTARDVTTDAPSSGTPSLVDLLRDALAAAGGGVVEVRGESAAPGGSLHSAVRCAFAAEAKGVLLSVAEQPGAKISLASNDAPVPDVGIDGAPVRPLAAAVTVAGVWLGRSPSGGIIVPNKGASPDLHLFRELLARDRRNLPKAPTFVLSPVDGQTFGKLFGILALARDAGYGAIMLGSAPAQVAGPASAYADAKAPIVIPARVSVDESGAFTLEFDDRPDRPVLGPDRIASFQQACSYGQCDTVVCLTDGKRYFVARTPDPMPGAVPDLPWLFGKQVRKADLSSIVAERAPETYGTWDLMPAGNFGSHMPIAQELAVARSRAPTAGADSALILGNLEKAQVDAGVRKKLGAIQACYQNALVSNVFLKGRLVLQFVVGPDGRVSSASVQETSLKSADVEQCVLQAVRECSFDKPRLGGAVLVSYPFNFAPG